MLLGHKAIFDQPVAEAKSFEIVPYFVMAFGLDREKAKQLGILHTHLNHEDFNADIRRPIDLLWIPKDHLDSIRGRCASGVAPIMLVCEIKSTVFLSKLTSSTQNQLKSIMLMHHLILPVYLNSKGFLRVYSMQVGFRGPYFPHKYGGVLIGSHIGVIGAIYRGEPYRRYSRTLSYIMRCRHADRETVFGQMQAEDADRLFDHPEELEIAHAI